jgi:acyl carrier protein
MKHSILKDLSLLLNSKLSIILDINLETNFKNDLGIDSLDLIEVIIEVEKEWHIVINSVEKLKTVNDLVEVIINETSKDV